MMNYYVATTESFRLEQDPNADIGYTDHLLVKARDEDEAHQKLHKWLYEWYDTMEGEWYISSDSEIQRRICSITEITTPSDLETVLETIE
jgi:hypothetical protein